ncbi:MAG TPA: NAD(+) diphosphatase [Candidatus Mediterraneibacter stercoravium]|uniref:NAD(+) diphosphatase n=1 Tax=Candidatus Mediterraneibacter stercoravium TaxID=2838685 RepID=A0A9D2K099_9FIRM|nr:NAD(+) diphosphatase [Candidatus Mediterraneibacter stercoravium]
MIQDIQPHHYDNQYRAVPPDPESYALYYEDHAALMRRTADGIAFPRFRELERLNEEIYEDCIYLFTIDEDRYYLVQELSREPLSVFTMENTEIFREAAPRYQAFAGITGYQLYNWYRNHKYCGRCGSMMKRDGKERMLYCEKCRNMEFPKICPAVIIGVTDGNRILMSKYAGRAYKKYALLAGFTEIGETAEETVKREVMEEVGLKVKNIRYYKSQPWSFSDTLLMGFYCELDGDGTITLDRNELAFAEWFEREDIPEVTSNESLTNEMIMRFKNGEVQEVTDYESRI